MKNKNIKKITRCGLLAAVSVVMMFLGAVIDVLDLSSAAIATVVVAAITLIYGKKTGIFEYIVIALLSAVLMPGRTVVYAFIAMGYYPVMRSWLHQKTVRASVLWIIKLVLFNALLALFFAFGKQIMFTPAEIESVMIYFIFPLGNVAFVLFDIALNRVLLRYGHILKKFL